MTAGALQQRQNAVGEAFEGCGGRGVIDRVVNNCLPGGADGGEGGAEEARGVANRDRRRSVIGGSREGRVALLRNSHRVRRVGRSGEELSLQGASSGGQQLIDEGAEDARNCGARRVGLHRGDDGRKGTADNMRSNGVKRLRGEGRIGGAVGVGGDGLVDKAAHNSGEGTLKMGRQSPLDANEKVLRKVQNRVGDGGGGQVLGEDGAAGRGERLLGMLFGGGVNASGVIIIVVIIAGRIGVVAIAAARIRGVLFSILLSLGLLLAGAAVLGGGKAGSAHLHADGLGADTEGNREEARVAAAEGRNHLSAEAPDILLRVPKSALHHQSNDAANGSYEASLLL